MVTQKMKIKEKVHINQRPVKGGGTALHLDYRVGGKRIREFLKLYLVPVKTRADKIKNEETLRLAVEIKNRRIRELDSGELNIASPKKVTAILAKDCMTEYAMKMKQKSRSNNLEVIQALERFKSNTRLTDIDREFFRGFMEFLFDQGLSQNTVLLYGRILKARVHSAYIDGLIPSMPNLIGLLPKPVLKDIEYLTIEELRKMSLTEAPDFIKNPFLFCCLTGLRFSDVKALCWENITDNMISLRMKKTGFIVRVPISKNAEAFLPDRKSNGSVFNIKTLSYLSKQLKKWAIAAGIKKNVHFHMSRDTFATLALNNGADLYTVSKLLGHTKITTTQIYAKVLDEGRKKAVDAIPLI